MNDKLLAEVNTLLSKYSIQNELLAIDLAIMVIEHERSTLLELQEPKV